MKELELYYCAHCGNIAYKLHDSKVPMFCCGEPMNKIEAKTADGALEKHVPEVKIDGNVVEVVVGSTLHPMTEAHHIEFILVHTDKGVQVKHLDPTGEPKATFVLNDEKVIAVYEYCNLHGLWKVEL